MPKQIHKYGKKFDSLLELKIWEIIKKDKKWSFHTMKIDYTITWESKKFKKHTTKHIYTPDFIYKNNGITYLYEAKAVFHTQYDRQKNQRLACILNNKNTIFAMILENENQKLKTVKKKTMGDWCREFNVPYTTVDQLVKRYNK